MSGDSTYRNPLIRDGQSQSGRNLPALSPDYIKVDERDNDDLISFASEYSQLIQYYNQQNEPEGNWGDFFKVGTSPDAPHYGLYLAFIRLFGHLQQDLNSITERHLNHYYREILQLKHKPAEADTVHLLIELAKNIDQQLIEKGTLLKAGKDALGKDLFYAIDKDIVLNKARVTELKTVFQESFFDTNGKLRNVNSHSIYAAPIANSTDGLGADLDTENLSWKLLGASQLQSETTMPKAALGFAISSPILLLKEGTRKITLEMELEQNIHPHFLPYFLAISLGSTDFVKSEIESLQQLISQPSLPDQLSEDQSALLKLTGSVLENHLIAALEALPTVDPDNPTPGDQKRIKWQILKDSLKATDADTGIPAFKPKAVFDALRLLTEYHLPKALEKAFVISLSGEEGWVGPFITDAIYQHGRLLKLEVDLTVEDPAVVGYNEKLLEGGFGDGQPLLKIMLNEHDSYQYSILRSLKPTKFKIHVSAQGVKNLVLQNDTANLNPNKTFQPFGPQPSTDNNFYIGSGEALQKSLSSLKLNLDWADLPDNFKSHYAVYTAELMDGYEQIKALTVQEEQLADEISNQRDLESQNKRTGFDFDTASDNLDKIRMERYNQEQALAGKEINIETFKASFQLLEGGEWKDLFSPAGDSEINLFNQGNKRSIQLKTGTYTRPENIQTIDKLDNSTLNGFIKLSLAEHGRDKFKAFGHQNFQKLYTKRIIEQLKPKNEDVTIQLPEEPYTPAISGISLDYTASLTIDTKLGKDHHESLFHIHPFGISEIGQKTASEASKTVLPTYSNEGELFIGLEELKPTQNLSILFQLNEKSVDHEFVGKVNVQWSYLRNNEWLNFKDTDILEDTTAIFTQSGIVTFQLPKDITNNNSLLPAGKHWLRASVANNTLGVADAMSIQAQAITASFVDNTNDPNHLDTPLSAKSIKKLKVSNSAIKSVTQAYPSFNGKLEEQDGTFYTRVSERLRHKRRSISIWDYEHIVLEAFPKVYKVKCLNHYDPEQTACRREMSPGAVTLIVLSRAEDETEISRKLAPITNVITLNAIKEHLKDITPPFIAARNKLFVKNPSHTPIKVNCAVKFNEGFDESYYKRELNTDLMKFFSPWAFDDTTDISFERKLYKSIIVNYIEELPYINFVCCFKVLKIDDTGNDQEITEDIIQAANPADILISHNEHQIYTVEGDTCNCEDIRKDETITQVVGSGIGAMVIETDFKVA